MTSSSSLSLIVLVFGLGPSALAQDAPAALEGHIAATQPAVLDARARQVDPGIVRLFDRLAEGIRRSEETRIMPLVDPRRLYDEMVKGGFTNELSRRQRTQLGMGLGLGLARSLAVHPSMIAWVRHEFVFVRLNDAGDEAVVLLKTWDEDGWVLRIRWWLFRRGDAWRFYDFQELGAPIRISVTLASIFAEDGTGKLELPEWASAGRDLVQALQAIAAEDVEQAALLLARTAKVQLPPTFEAMRELAWGTLQMIQEEPEKALAHFDRAGGLAKKDADGDGMPLLLFLRATCYNALERYDEAEHEARQSLAELGGDPQTYEQLGIALTALEREDEAREAYRMALDDSPAYVDCLAALARLLPRSGMSELEERFRNVPRAAEHFEAVAMQLLDADSAHALETLVAAFRKMRPNDPNGDYYGAQAKMTRGKYDEAAALLKAAIPRVGDDEERGYYVAEYVDALLRGGKPLEAYAAAADPMEALHLVGDYLVVEDDEANLRALTSAHRKRHPRDKWLHYYDGRAAHFAGDYDVAERAFAAGLERADEDDRHLFRAWRVDALHKSGQWKKAYKELGATGSTFEQLADLMVDAKKPDELSALIQMHRAARPEARRLTLWEAEIPWLRRDYAAVVKLLENFGDKITVDDDEYWRYEDRLLRSLVRGGRFKKALEVAEASTARDDDQWYEIVVHAAAGDAQKMLAAIGECIDHGCFLASQMYDDDDIGQALRTESLKPVRERYPKHYKPPSGVPDWER